MKFPNDELIESFSEINRAIYKLLKIDADRAGITVVQVKALYQLSSHPNCGLGELAEKLRLTNSTVSGVIDRLVLQDLVERIIPPEDRRSISLKITESGQAILNKISSESCLIQRVAEVMQLPKEEIDELFRLHKLVLSKLTLKGENEG